MPAGTVNTTGRTSWPSGGVAGEQPDQHHDRDQQDQRTVTPSMISSSRVPPRAGTMASAYTPTSASADEQERRPVGGASHSPTSVRNATPKIPAADDGDHAVERVGAQQRPAGDHARTGAEGGADEAVHRAGVVELLGQPHEGVRHEQHAHGGQREGQRHGPADLPAVPCGLMLAAIDGAIRATEIPMASQMLSSRRRPGGRGFSRCCPCAGSRRPASTPHGQHMELRRRGGVNYMGPTDSGARGLLAERWHASQRLGRTRGRVADVDHAQRQADGRGRLVGTPAQVGGGPLGQPDRVGVVAEVGVAQLGMAVEAELGQHGAGERPHQEVGEHVRARLLLEPPRQPLRAAVDVVAVQPREPLRPSRSQTSSSAP